MRALILVLLSHLTPASPAPALERYIDDVFAHMAPRHKKRALKTVPYIRKYAALYDVPELLIAVTIRRESAFRSDAKGALGERGVMQLHGVARRGCDLKTLDGQIKCGARWLRVSHDTCGDWLKGINYYMTGRCEPVHRWAKRRYRDWQRAESRYVP